MFDFSKKKCFPPNFNNTLLFNYNTYRCKIHMEDVLRDPKNNTDMWFVSVHAVVDEFYTIEDVDQFSAGIETAKTLRSFQPHKTRQPLHVQIQTTYQECSSYHVEHLPSGVYICTCLWLKSNALLKLGGKHFFLEKSNIC